MSDAIWLAWISLATSILGPISLAIAFWIRSQAFATKGQVAEVHTIVNQQRTDMEAKIERLERELVETKQTAKDLAKHAGPTKEETIVPTPRPPLGGR